MNFKLKARVNRSDARTIRHALEPLSAKGSEKEAIKAQKEFLKKRLEQDHPNHISYFLTPDRPE
jgi:hypothetical protein